MKNAGARYVLFLSILGTLLVPGDSRGMSVDIAADETVFIQVGDTWRFLRGTEPPSDPPDAWRETDFVDMDWESGPSGFGYDDGDDATPLNDMRYNYWTVYIRKEFSVEAPIQDGVLQLEIDYDDGFVAYLNGEEVARRHMPDGEANYQTAASSHEAGSPETIPLGRAADLLQDGKNVLAIEGHNTELDSSDFSLIPILRVVPDIVRIEDVWIVVSDTIALEGSTAAPDAVTVKIGSVDADFDPLDGTWRGEVSLAPGRNTVTVTALDAGGTPVDTGIIEILYVPPANHVGGPLAEDTVWSGAYIVDATVTVPTGLRLTIEAGSIILLKEAVSLIVQGQLLADGTEADPIRFTHASDGGTWKQILLIQAADSRFAHCIIEYADSEGKHQDYYGEGSRDYHEAVVALACHLDIEGCLFQRLPDESAGAEGDAIAIISDDPDYPGEATANIGGCQFIGIGQGVHTRYSYVLVEDCLFTAKRGDNDDVDLYGESDPPPLIRYNQFLYPEADDAINPTKCSAVIIGNVITGSRDHGVVLRDRSFPVMINNLVSNCRNAGIAVENSCEALLVNNTIVDCPSRGLRLFDLGRWGPPYNLQPGGGTATVINCIIRNCPQPITLSDSDNTGIEDRGSHITIRHSNIEGGEGAISVSGAESTVTWGEGNIDADPRFVDVANGDYHLQEGSPAIDTGTADEAPATDLDGLPRPCGEGYDMGAYEYCDELPLLILRGDPNSDGQIDVSDAIMTLLYLFSGGAEPLCFDTADANDDGAVEVTDVIFLLAYLFTGGEPLPSPAGQCGVDRTDDLLTCPSHSPCE